MAMRSACRRRTLAAVVLLGGLLEGCASAPSPRAATPPAAPAQDHGPKLPAFLLPATACPADVAPPAWIRGAFSVRDCAADLAACHARCEAGQSRACYESALHAQEQKQRPLSEALFLRACRLGDASGCTNRAAGMLSADDTADTKSVFACTDRTFELTCAAGDAWGCTMFGRALMQRGKGREQIRVVLLAACASTEEADPACQAARRMIRELDQR